MLRTGSIRLRPSVPCWLRRGHRSFTGRFKTLLSMRHRHSCRFCHRSHKVVLERVGFRKRYDHRIANRRRFIPARIRIIFFGHFNRLRSCDRSVSLTTLIPAFKLVQKAIHRWPGLLRRPDTAHNRIEQRRLVCAPGNKRFWIHAHFGAII